MTEGLEPIGNAVGRVLSEIELAMEVNRKKEADCKAEAARRQMP